MGKEVRQAEPFWIVLQLGRTVDAVFLENGSLEGGDVFVFDSACLVGLSERTNQAGIASLASAIDRPVVGVPLRPGILHLDTALNVIGDRLVVAPELLENYDELKGKLGALNVSTVVTITADDAFDLETNFIFVDPKRALVSAHSIVGRKILEASGVEVVDVPMEQHHRIGGSVRCATLPLERES